MSNDQVFLTSENKSPIAINVLTSTMGEKEIDIRNLEKQGYFTFDPGFTSTASCESRITYIDGKKGTLLYRGFPIDQLALTSNYLEVCYILLNNEIPTHTQYIEFCKKINQYRRIHKHIIRAFQGCSRHSHPMSVLCGIMISLAAFYNESLCMNVEAHRNIAIFQLISKIPIIAAMCHKYSSGKNFVYPKDNLSYTGNLLYMMFSTPKIKYVVDPMLEYAMNRILIVHADHEQNLSTSTVRMVGSSGTNLFACIAAGITALWGQSHGGANEACLRMLEQINKVEHIPKYIQRAKDSHDTFRLMGFGHRIYKHYDPRATLMRQTCYELLKELNISENLFEIAIELERVALNDSYFIERKLYPNVDFYSGIILKAIGIPTSMFTVIFTVARAVGWVTHWKEMYNSGLKISRPRQLYSGYSERKFNSYITKNK